MSGASVSTLPVTCHDAPGRHRRVRQFHLVRRVAVLRLRVAVGRQHARTHGADVLMSVDQALQGGGGRRDGHGKRDGADILWDGRPGREEQAGHQNAATELRQSGQVEGEDGWLSSGLSGRVVLRYKNQLDEEESRRETSSFCRGPAKVLPRQTGSCLNTAYSSP